MSIYVFVCGYKRTGKDILYSILSGSDKFRDCKWDIYSRAGVDVSIFLDRSKSDFIRVAIADPLKQYVREIYDLPAEMFNDDNKDKKIEGKDYSPRDLLIRHSKDRQWHVEALQGMVRSASSCIVTDWRFQHEYKYITENISDHVCTVRVFRKDVPVPAEDVISEHDLDKISTDVLLLPEGEGTEKCFELFPQYREFELRGQVAHIAPTKLHE